MSEEQIEPRVYEKKIFIPKTGLKFYNLRYDQVWANIAALAKQFGYSGIGWLLVALAAGEVELVISQKKRRP